MYKVDPEIKALQDSILLSKIARARREPIGSKILDGPRLFDRACERMRSGIRHQHPSFTAEQVDKELRRRLRIRKLLDDAGLYQDAGAIDDK